jgi:biopolymer transport protein ExbD
MLDVVFIMLIFFIVTASFIRESGIDLNRSDAPAPPIPASDNILVTISGDNEIWVDGRLIDYRAVRPNIERMHAEKPDATVVIQADRQSANKTLVQVMDASRAAGIYDIAIAENGDSGETKLP